MPNSIDERVVRMTFDNERFEKRVGESIKSLDELKKALDLDDMSNSLKSLEKAANGIDLSKLEDSVSSIADKFTFLGKIEQKILDDLSGRVVKLGKDLGMMAIGLEVNGKNVIKEGQGKYETQTKAVQTITNATGQSVKEVESVLAKLQKYTDETSYDFAEMVSSIGKFTSVGIDLEQAESAMEGIASWAAKSGAGKSEANRAMYNISQAMSAGYMKLMDWKSIENANMATKEFKETAIQTAIEMGALADAGNGMGAIVSTNEKTLEAGQKALAKAKTAEQYAEAQKKIASATKEVTVDYKNFNETLKDGWLNSEVMIATLNKYADQSTDFGLAAYHAAQEALTFSDAIDAVADALSSGWMQTLKYLFGDLDEARVFFTDVANELVDFTDKFTSYRNAILEDWHAWGGYKDLMESINNVWQTFVNIVDGAREALAEVFPPITAENLLGFTSGLKEATGQLRAMFGLDTETEIEHTYEFAVDYAEKLTDILKNGSSGSMVANLQAELAKAGYAADLAGEEGVFGKKTEAAVKRLQKALGVDVTGAWDEATRSAAIANKVFVNAEEYTYTATHKNVEEVTEEVETIVDYAQKLNDTLRKGDNSQLVASLQERLIHAGYLADSAGASGIYGPETEEAVKRLQKDLGVQMNGVWDDTTRNAAIAKEVFQEIEIEERGMIYETNGLTKAMSRMQEILKGLASVVDIIKMGAGTVISIAKNVLSFFSPLIDVVARLGAMIGMMFKNLDSELKHGDGLARFVEDTTSALYPFAIAIEMIAGFFQDFINGYADFLRYYKVGNTFENFFYYIVDYLRNATPLGPVIDFIGGIINLIGYLAQTAYSVISSLFGDLSALFGDVFFSGNPNQSPLASVLQLIFGLAFKAVKVVSTLLQIGGTLIGSVLRVALPVLFPILSTVATILGNVLEIVVQLTPVLAPMAPVILGIAAAWVVLQKTFGRTKIFSGIFGFISPLRVVLTLLGLLAGFAFKDDIGRFLSNIGGWFQKTFPTVSKALSDLLKWDTKVDFFTNIRKKFIQVKDLVLSLFTDLRTAASNFWKGLSEVFNPTSEEDLGKTFWERLTERFGSVKSVGDFVRGVWDTLSNTVKSIFSSDSFFGLIGGVISNALTVVKNVFGTAASVIEKLGAGNVIDTILSVILTIAVARIASGIKGIGAGIKQLGEGFKLLGKAQEEEKKDSIGTTLLKMAGSLLIIGIAIKIMDTVDLERCIKILEWIGIFLLALVGVTELFTWVKSKAGDNFVDVGEVVENFGKGLMQIALAIGTLSLVFKMFGGEGGTINQAIMTISGFIIGLAVIEGIISYLLSKTGGENSATISSGEWLYDMCKGLLAIALALGMVAKAYKKYGNETMANAGDFLFTMLLTLGGLQIALAGVTGWMSKGKVFGSVSKMEGVTSMCMGVYILALAIGRVAKLIKQYGDEQVQNAFGLIEGLLITAGGIAVAMAAFTKGPGGKISGGAAVIGIIAVAFAIKMVVGAITEAIKGVKDIDPELIKWFTVGSALLIGVMGALMLGFTALAGPSGSNFLGLVAGAVAFLTFVGIFEAAIGVLAAIVSKGIESIGESVWKFGHQFGSFAGEIQKIDFNKFSSFGTFIKDTLPGIITSFIMLKLSNADKKAVELRNMAANISLFALFVGEITGDTLTACDTANMMLDKAKVMAEKVNLIPPILGTGSRSAIMDLGFVLMLYSEFMSDLDMSALGNGQAIAEAAVTAGQTISELGNIEEAVDKLMALAAGLYLYYGLLNELPKDDSGSLIAPTGITKENVQAAFGVMKDAVDEETISQLSSYGSGKEHDMYGVARGIIALGYALKVYGENVGTLKTDDINTANSVIDEVKKIDDHFNGFTLKNIFQIPDRKSLQDFAGDVGELGKTLKTYGDNIGGLTGDSVKNANAVIDELLKIDRQMEKGFWEQFFSLFGVEDNTLSAFTTNVKTIGGALGEYGTSIQTLDGAPILRSVFITKSIASVAQSLEPFVYDKSFTYVSEKPEILKQFASAINLIGGGLRDAYNALKGTTDASGNITDTVDLTLIENAITTISKLKDIYNGLDYDFGNKNFLNQIETKDLSVLTNKLPGMATDLTTFASNAKSFNPSDVEQIFQTFERVIGWTSLYNGQDSLGFIAAGLSSMFQELAALAYTPFSEQSTLSAMKGLGEKITAAISEGITGVDANGTNPIVAAIQRAVESALTLAAPQLQNDSMNFGMAIALGIAAGIATGTPYISGAIQMAMQARNKWPDMTEALTALPEGGLRAVQGVAVNMLGTVGQYMVGGLTEGVNDYMSEAVRAVLKMTRLLKETAEGDLEIASPSKRFEWYGEMIALGLKNGIDKYKGLVTDASLDLANASIDEITNALDYSNPEKIYEGALDTLSMYNLRSAENLQQFLVATKYLNPKWATGKWNKGSARAFVQFKKEVFGASGKIVTNQFTDQAFERLVDVMVDSWQNGAALNDAQSNIEKTTNELKELNNTIEEVQDSPVREQTNSELLKSAEWYGKMIAIGLKNGIDKYKSLVTDSSIDLAKASVDEIATVLDYSDQKKVRDAAIDSITLSEEALSAELKKYDSKFKTQKPNAKSKQALSALKKELKGFSKLSKDISKDGTLLKNLDSGGSKALNAVENMGKTTSALKELNTALDNASNSQAKDLGKALNLNELQKTTDSIGQLNEMMSKSVVPTADGAQKLSAQGTALDSNATKADNYKAKLSKVDDAITTLVARNEELGEAGLDFPEKLSAAGKSPDDVFDIGENLMVQNGLLKDFGNSAEDYLISSGFKDGYLLVDAWTKDGSVYLGQYRQSVDEILSGSTEITKTLFANNNAELAKQIADASTEAQRQEKEIQQSVLSGGDNYYNDWLKSLYDGSGIKETLNTTFDSNQADVENVLTSKFEDLKATAEGAYNNFVGEDGKLDILGGIAKTISGNDGAKALTEAADGVVKLATGEVTGIVEEIKAGIAEDTEDLGSDAIAGLDAGVLSELPSVEDAITQATDTLIGTAKENLDEHSPSKVFEEIGMFLVQGMIQGIETYAGFANDAVQNLANGLVQTATLGVEGLNAVLSSDGEFPMIRPVIDLTAVEAQSTGIRDILERQGIHAKMSIADATMVAARMNIQKVDEFKQTYIAGETRKLHALTAIQERIGVMERDLANMKVYINGNTLLGWMTPRIDRALYNSSLLAGRMS